MKQAGRCWNRTLDHFLTDFCLVRSTVDNCCYSKTTSAGNKLFVCVLVDDIMYFSTCSISRESFKDSFSRRFEIEDKGLMKWFLGVSVQQSSDEIFLSQKPYILELLVCFDMTECYPCDLPIIANTRFDKNSCP